MSHVIRVCVDLAPPPKTSTERLALIKGNKWNAGDVIRIRFLGGAADLQNKVKKYAVEWTKYANLKLYFAADPNADIRIASAMGRGPPSAPGATPSPRPRRP